QYLSFPSEIPADADARRKIQFSVPSSVPTQLDPRQVEMIRRRRPTPATLFRLTDPPSPEEDSSPHQWVLGENGALKAKLVHMSTYQPPSLKAVQKMAQAHLSSLDMKSVDTESSSGEEEEQHDEERIGFPIFGFLLATIPSMDTYTLEISFHVGSKRRKQGTEGSAWSPGQSDRRSSQQRQRGCQRKRGRKCRMTNEESPDRDSFMMNQYA
uniref:Protein phosphatase 1 regulatory subunit 1B n=1 Tax=Haplochromis burtoni TaxID=8153 RepID=A0A3Q2WXB4_HAPBU